MIFEENYAEIAQLVEHNLAKVGVASSSLVFRSKRVSDKLIRFFLNYRTRTGGPLPEGAAGGVFFGMNLAGALSGYG